MSKSTIIEFVLAALKGVVKAVRPKRKRTDNLEDQLKKYREQGYGEEQER